MNSAEDDPRNELRTSAWDKVHICHGSFKIMELLANRYRNLLRISSLIGFLFPLLAVVVILFNLLSVPNGPRIVGLATAVVTLLQVVFLIWGAVDGWQDKLISAKESKDINKRYRDKYESLAKNPPAGLQTLADRLKALGEQLEIVDSVDSRIVITEELRRFGRRAILYAYELKCASCGETPVSIEPGKCKTCGSFPRRFCK